MYTHMQNQMETGISGFLSENEIETGDFRIYAG